MNGKPGDHPLTDILVHQLTVYSPQIDELIRTIVAVGGQQELENRFDLFAPPPLEQFGVELSEMLSRLEEEARARGWEVT